MNQPALQQGADAAAEAQLRRAWRSRAHDPHAARTVVDAVLGAAVLDDSGAGTPVGARAAALRLRSWLRSASSDFADAAADAREAMALAAGDAAAEAAAATLLGTALFRTGATAEAHAMFERALALTGTVATTETPAATETVAATETPATTEEREETRAAAFWGMGQVASDAGRYPESMAHYQQALGIAQQAGLHAEEARAWLGIGNTHDSMANYEQAMAAYRTALEIAERTGQAQCQAYALGNIGMMHERAGDLQAALDCERRSLELKRALGDRWGAGVSLNNIGIIHKHRGNYSEALNALHEALETAEAIGDASGEMIALHNIADIRGTMGNGTQVLRYHQRVRDIAERLGDRRGVAFALGDIGRFHAALGETGEALLHLLAALRAHQAIGDRYGERSALETIAGLHGLREEFASAIEHAEAAVRIAEETSEALGLASALGALGSALSGAGRHTEAIAVLERAMQGARAIDSANAVMTAAERLASAHAAAGDAEAAARFAAIARDGARAMFDTEETRRIVAGFEQRRLRGRAARLGLRAEDLETLAKPGPAPAAAGNPGMGKPGTGNPGAGSAGADATGTAAGAAAKHASGTSATVRVRAFGELHVSVGARELQPGDFGRRKARDLFKFLLLHHRRTLTLGEIIEALYGGVADRATELVAMNAISRVRKALQPERSPRNRDSMLASRDGAYRLDLGDDADIDFLRFKELIVAARRASVAAEKSALYARAVELHAGEFLPEDRDQEWATGERELLKDALLEAMEYIAGEHLRRLAHEDAAETARRIIAIDATSELGYDVLMRSLAARGRTADLAGTYELARAAFARDLGIEPPAALRRLAESLAQP